MTFRQALGLTWMAAMAAFTVEHLPFFEMAGASRPSGEMALGYLFLVISLVWIVGPGYLIGWSSLDD